MGLKKIQATFTELNSQSRGGLIPFVTGGYPTLDVTSKVLPVLQQSGASLIEVGFPFSDPIADGPTIAATMAEVLDAGVRINQIMEAVAAARPHVSCPIIAMVSSSIVYRHGSEPFLADLVASGFDGLIVPDLDLTQAPRLRAMTDQHDLGLILLASATTSEKRLEQIARSSTGFIYLLARTGLTGEQTEAPDIKQPLLRLRAITKTPIAAGFGISTPDHVSAVVEHADAAIVGSSLVRRMAEAEDPLAESAQYITSLALAAAAKQ